MTAISIALLRLDRSPHPANWWCANPQPDLFYKGETIETKKQTLDGRRHSAQHCGHFNLRFVAFDKRAAEQRTLGNARWGNGSQRSLGGRICQGH